MGRALVDGWTRGRGEAGLFATAANRRLAVRQPTSSSDSTRPGPSSRHHRADTIRQERDTVTDQTGNFPLKFGCKMNFISFLFAGCPCSRVHVAGYVHLKILSGVQNRYETARLSCDNNKILVSAQNHTRETITRPATIFGRGEILLKRGPAPFPRLSLPSSRRGRTVHPTPATR